MAWVFFYCIVIIYTHIDVFRELKSIIVYLYRYIYIPNDMKKKCVAQVVRLVFDEGKVMGSKPMASRIFIFIFLTRWVGPGNSAS